MNLIPLQAAKAMLQLLEAIRASNPELIADNAPAGWGMNRFREVFPVDQNDPLPTDTTQVNVEHWNSPRYGGTEKRFEGNEFVAEIVDQRQGSGSLLVSMTGESDEIDDVLSAALEVSDLPGSSAPVATLMVYDGDEVVFKLIKQPNGHLMVPMKSPVRVVVTRLPDASPAWMISS